MGLSSPLYCLIFISFLVDSEAGLPSYGLWGKGFRSAHRLAARALPPHRKGEFLAPDLLVGRGPLVIGGPEVLGTHHPSPELSTQFHWRAGQRNWVFQTLPRILRQNSSEQTPCLVAS